MSLLVCFSGQIGSGKSSLTEAVADKLQWPRAGFGDYLRAELRRRGEDPASRKALQDLGQRLVEEDADGFCRAVLRSGGFEPGDDFVVDGVRHVDIYRRLRLLAAPSAARLIFLDADESQRQARIASRADGDDFNRASEHRVELELARDLPSAADVVIDATRPLPDVVAECFARVEAWRGQ